jgi:hypothetical protein
VLVLAVLVFAPPVLDLPPVLPPAISWCDIARLQCDSRQLGARTG